MRKLYTEFAALTNYTRTIQYDEEATLIHPEPLNVDVIEKKNIEEEHIYKKE